MDINDLKEALDDETILVSVMYVNNEIGAVEPIEEIGHIVKSYNPDIVFHVDAIQAYGKYKIVPKKYNIDLLSVSGHKIHGPKGSGFLYIKDKTRIKPIIYGGGQQKGMRSGTEMYQQSQDFRQQSSLYIMTSLRIRLIICTSLKTIL